jgi:hypothetical protein
VTKRRKKSWTKSFLEIYILYIFCLSFALFHFSTWYTIFLFALLHFFTPFLCVYTEMFSFYVHFSLSKMPLWKRGENFFRSVDERRIQPGVYTFYSFMLILCGYFLAFNTLAQLSHYFKMTLQT